MDKIGRNVNHEERLRLVRMLIKICKEIKKQCKATSNQKNGLK